MNGLVSAEHYQNLLVIIVLLLRDSHMFKEDQSNWLGNVFSAPQCTRRL